MIAPKKKTTRRERFASLLKRNPVARIAEGLDEAYVGFTVGEAPSVAIYDYDHAVRIICASPDFKETEADLVDFFELYNILAFECEHAPVFMRFDE